MSIIEESEINSEMQRLEEEIETYRKLIEKAKKKNLELTEKELDKILKPIALSDLLSPNAKIQSSSELESKCKRCVDLILQYGREIL